MALDRPYRRLPLRDLLTDAEKRSRDLVDHLGTTWMTRVSDLRDLSRPVRRKSHYPTLLALHNAVQKVIQLTRETQEMIEYLEAQLADIREHGKRERLSRS